MMQNAAKRKSECALLPAKHPKSEKESSSSPSPLHELSSDEMFVQDAPDIAKHVKKRARKSEPALKTRVDAEYEEDIGRMESQSFLALVEFESKKKRKANKENIAYKEKWEQTVSASTEKLKDAMEQGSLKSNNHSTQFLKFFKSAYGATRACTPSTDQVTNQHLSTFAAMRNKSKEITETASALLAEFDKVSQRIDGLDTATLVENEWGDQDEMMAGLLLEGKRIGIKKYRRILKGASESKEEDPEGEHDAKGAYFFDSEEKTKSVWGEVAKKQVKAMKKLVNTIQVEVA